MSKKSLIINSKKVIVDNKIIINADKKYIRGITLITLVITIILLIILAGIAINISFGQNGIFTRAKQAKEKYSESVAREKLEMVLIDAMTEKQINLNYNSNEFLDDMLKKSGIEVNGDNVIVDSYNFKINREKLKIEQNLGELSIKVSKEVKKYLGKNENGKYEAEILVIIESDKELQSIEIKNTDGTTLEMETNKTKIAKDMVVEFDEEYTLIITDKTGKTENRKVVEKTEEIIRTAEELVIIRDKVNNGLTYEGKIIKQAKGIDLNTVCNSEIGTWEPIGNDVGIYFKGTYDGNNNELANLYINTNKETAIGLFGRLGYTGKIKNLTVTGHIERTNYTDSAMGVVVGRNEGSVENVTNKAAVISGGDAAGGIVGNNLNTITRCTNKGKITSSGSSVGGICGISNGNIESANITEDIQPKIRQCRNTIEATINGLDSVGGILGYGMTKINIGQCYNAGTINGSRNVGGIAGYIDDEDGKYGYIGNSYNTGDINATENNAGGLIGYIASSNKEVGNGYNIGKITCPKYAGGVVGVNNGALWGLYYLNKGGVSHGCGINNSSTGLDEPEGSTEQTLKNLAKGMNNNNGDETWKNDETNINNGYPILLWQIEK